MSSITDCYTKPILVFGCGNILFGDDGFGPAVIEHFEKNYNIPDNVCILNAGTSIRGILFDIILNETKPKRIIIIDAVDVGKSPGEIFEIPIENIPVNKIDDFSMHQMPTSNMLKELKDLCNVDVRIIVAQVENVPEVVNPGLSQKLINAIPATCQKVQEMIKNI